jgi:hypothetical protein
MGCEECTALDLPLSLCSDGKPDLVDFVDHELIYRRHNEPGNLDTLKKLNTSQIGNKVFQLRSDSYNRSELSSPQHVLLNTYPAVNKGPDYYKKWGIISLKVNDVNSENEPLIINNVIRQCKIKVVHVKEPCNYSHSEIHFFVDDCYYDSDTPRVAKTHFRDILKGKINVLKEYLP